MKKFWKVLGVAALAAGFTPYKVNKNEETGESTYQALLWQLTTAPSDNGDKRKLTMNLGVDPAVTSMIREKTEKKEESHLFSDEISVEYAPADCEGVIGEAAEKAAEAVEKVEDAAEAAAEKAAEKIEEAEKEVEKIVEAAEPVQPAASEEPKTQE